MQSLTQMMKSGPKPAEIEAGQNPVTTESREQPLDGETGAQPIVSETEAQVVDNKSAVSLEGETLIAPDENGEGAQLLGGETLQLSGNVADTQALESEAAVPSHDTGGTAVDSTSKPSAPTELVPDGKQNPDCAAEEARKVDKVVPENRKYIPCKKDRLDPLKMDMSKPVVMPLTSSQLSLQCIECHIIFSDHKSKERHLKLSHPAEYEQCILRNALFACYVCDRHFTNSTELMAHQKAHIEKKPFKCPICSQAFNKSSELTLHKKIHFGRDGYACADCGKPCKTLTLLKYHRRTHTGERPYVCKECGKRFSMSKALQKHMLSHSPENAEGDGGDTSATAKAQQKKNNGTTVKYPCSVCKATFKTTKTRLHHMKTKHNLLPSATSNAIQPGQQVKEAIPIITPISICQPALLQMEPIGPLQQVDANIDTEQIRKLIESLGNVQKVNQVVILGQVPPNASPLELQQISEPVNLNLTPQQMDIIEIKQTESKTAELDSSKNTCESMEQTIILEPITPDGQLENPSFSELGSHLAASETIELTLVEPEQTERHEGEMMHQILQQPETGTNQSDSVNQMVCQSEVVDLKENLEQTVILEFTSALMPTVELEETQPVPQSEMPSSSLVPSTELEKISHETVIGQQEANLSVPLLLPTVELELTPLQTDQQDLPGCPFIPADAFTQTPDESQPNSKAEADSDIQTVSLNHVHSLRDETPVENVHERTEQEPSENLLVDSRESQEQVEKLSEEDDSPAKEEISQSETKQVQHTSHLPVNVMSAQELVKVRKRKPARTFIFQENMQELLGTTQKNNEEIDVIPAKRQRTKKSHLVVKFGPQNKEKKNKKTKHSQQHHSAQEEQLKCKSSTTNLSGEKLPSPKKGRTVKKGKTKGHSVSRAEIKASSTHNPQVPQIKENIRKNKMKRQKDVTSDGVKHVSEQKIVVSPVFKKKKQPKIMQKSQAKKKDGKLTSKEMKKKSTKEEKMNTETSTVSATMPGQQITQDSLLLLKGHKQPQLKVYKLDPAKASAQTQETAHKLQTTSQQSDDVTLKKRKVTSTSENKLTTRGKKKGGRPKKNQKALSLLSSLRVPTPPPETMPCKPKTTRKRKASSKVETEGIITSSHSRRALECKDCGERFSEVSSLQEHKTTVHVVESPGLTYTNGNIFEGVSRLDLGQPPERHDVAIGVMNAATDWDTEAEMGEMALEDKERSVSFPALNPSPSLPVTAPDAETSGYEDKSGSTPAAEIAPFMDIAKELPDHSSQCLTPPEVVSPYPSKTDQKKMFESNSDDPPHFTSKTSLNISTKEMASEAGEHLTSDEDKSTYQSSRQDITKSPLVPSSESEVQGTADEDIKEGLLLEVDLVTVGEQNDRDDLTLAQDSGSQNELVEPCNAESSSTDTQLPPGQIDNESTSEIKLTSQTVSCSTHEPEIKEEEEEILEQRKEEGVRGVTRRSVTRGRRRGTGRLKKAVLSRKSSVCDDVREKDPVKDVDECCIVYQKYPLTSNSEISDGGEISKLNHAQSTSQSSEPEISPRFQCDSATAPATSVPSIPSSSEEPPEEQVIFQLEPVTTSVEEVTKSEERLGLEGAEEQDRDSGQSPGIIIERILPSTQKENGDKEQGLVAIRNNKRQGLDCDAETEVVFREVPRGQEIKVEENISDPPLVIQSCQSRQRTGLQPQHQHDIRTVLVKQETSLSLNDAQTAQGSRHIRWNVEQINTENTSGPESEEMTRDSSMAPDFNTNQCIFYPVKEEEREVLLGASQSDSSTLTMGVSSNARPGDQAEYQPASSSLHEGSHPTEDYQEPRVRGVLSRAGVTNFANTEGEADIAWQDAAELRDFLLQSSDSEDPDVSELSDPQLDSEAEVMACYYKNQSSGPPQPIEMSHNLPTSDSHLNSHVQREGNRSREPIDYFSKYFGWDTWVEIAQCTNKQSNMLNPVTAKEVAQFVGIHIAMGTLKFPSLKLYWQDFTKVPLIAEAMPLPQFLQLSRKLKLAFPAKDPINNVRVEGHNRDIQNAQHATTVTGALRSGNYSRNGRISLLGDGQSQWDKPNEANSLSRQTDALWKVQPLLRRFQAGCQLLSREGDYGVDQYPLPLTTSKLNNKKFSLHCTTLIGFGGLILHLDLKLDLADKEDAVEKMVPRGSMVFLCKQELSTPAMLERLLLAGVHGAGRVGGERGQIGDEFVSSDGKLMLRRSHRGFILSTVGHGHRNMASLIDNFEKAQMSARLNRDLQNLYRIPLSTSVPTCWPQAVLWFLTDLALVNSWLLYRQNQASASEPLTLMAFRLEVSKALILSSGSDTQDSAPPQPPTQKAHTTSETPNPSLLEESPLPDAATRYDGSGHWPEQLGEGEGGRCRFGGCERTSRVLCLKCCVFLCISRNHNCFLNFHNQGSLGNE
ncbi:zinc finger protein 576, tandem duplicate 1 isoform X2 [Myripristis murdjan]|uniref:Uncharacterized LOC115374414 n=1 Tax=Myripristis murdjan TaxID=586833 RepID=A0A667ZH45_9TELE|nr:uncharacterized protein LOC115374414 isoform X2 [Myripristis murdjan]